MNTIRHRGTAGLGDWTRVQGSTGAATTVVSTGPIFVGSVVVSNKGGAGETTTLRESTATSGTMVQIELPANETDGYTLELQLDALRIDTSSSSVDVLVTHD